MSSSPVGRPGATARDAAPLSLVEDSLTVSLHGHLTGSNAMLRLQLFTLAATGGPTEVIVNLSDIQSVDQDGVEPLLEAQDVQHRRGGVLRVECPSAEVLHFLHQHPRHARLLVPPGNHVQPAAEASCSISRGHLRLILSDRRTSVERASAPRPRTTS